MLLIIEILIFALVGFFLSYLWILTVLALFVPLRKEMKTERLRKFAFVVPAHDEADNIAKTVNSIRQIDYPSSLFDVVVLADNCSDSTAAVAWVNGAMVLERSDPYRRGKGYALQWGFDLLLSAPAKYDGLVVIDADSVVSKNYLRVVNWYLEQGYGSIQTADLVAPNPGAWSSEVSRISLTLYNYARPLGRKVLHCSAGLRGNGMCFASETLRIVPWKAHSLTEDLEYGLMLLLRGIPSVFAPEARVLATMPARSKNAESQRARWEGGRLPVIAKYAPLLFLSAFQRDAWRRIDALIELLTPAFVNMVAAVLAVIAGKHFLSWGFSFRSGLPVEYWYFLLALSVVYVGIGLVAAKADRSLYKAVLYFPLYLVWKIQLYAKLAFHGLTKEWIRTAREH